MPISEIYNLSISCGVFPGLQSCKPKTFLRKRKKTDHSNYRTISLLPITSKVTKKIVHDQTNILLSDNHILYNF